MLLSTDGSALVDTVIERPTPEGVAIRLRPAGPLPRAGAALIDIVLVSIFMMFVALVLVSGGAVGVGIVLLVWFTVHWGYDVLFEVWGGGATPGKRKLGLVVVHDDGTAVGLGASVIRNLLRSADFLPFSYALGLISIVCDRDFRRLGDRVAGTLVVHHGAAPSGLEVPTASPLPPPVGLTPAERTAIVAFAERQAGWSPTRLGELAAQAQPLVDGASDPTARLIEIANWVIGRRERPR